MDKVAGILEVGLTLDDREVVICHPDLKPDPRGDSRILLMPRHARHLANLLIENAEYSENETLRVALILKTAEAKSTDGITCRVSKSRSRGMR